MKQEVLKRQGESNKKKKYNWKTENIKGKRLPVINKNKNNKEKKKNKPKLEKGVH